MLFKQDKNCLNSQASVLQNQCPFLPLLWNSQLDGSMLEGLPRCLCSCLDLESPFCRSMKDSSQGLALWIRCPSTREQGLLPRMKGAFSKATHRSPAISQPLASNYSQHLYSWLLCFCRELWRHPAGLRPWKEAGKRMGAQKEKDLLSSLPPSLPTSARIEVKPCHKPSIRQEGRDQKGKKCVQGARLEETVLASVLWAPATVFKKEGNDSFVEVSFPS